LAGLSKYPVQLAVNISAVQFNSDSAVAEIAAILKRSGRRAELLQIEVTESVMMGPVQSSAEKLRQLRNLGVTVALDDFGTGYSSLSYLAELPFDSLKSDRSFVLNLTASSEALTLVKSLIGLARNMHMTVIVEGIEEAAQLELLRDLGADQGQGYLLGRPDGNPSSRLALQQALPVSDLNEVMRDVGDDPAPLTYIDSDRCPTQRRQHKTASALTLQD